MFDRYFFLIYVKKGVFVFAIPDIGFTQKEPHLTRVSYTSNSVYPIYSKPTALDAVTQKGILKVRHKTK